MAKFTARTVQQISDAIQADKASRSALDPINTTSDASVYLNLVNAMAVAVNLHENAFVAFANEVELRALELQPGIPRWYAAESLVFQFGDSLELIDGNLTYATIDTTKQIVKLAAADKLNGFLVLKIAALQGDGTARPLTAPELTAFRAYWDEKKFACTPLDFISQSGDIARITYRIGVDATVIDPTNGQLLTDASVYPVENAITEFLRTYQAERFNSVLRLTDLTDTIQGVDGVINVVAEDVQIRPSDGSFVDVIATDNDEYLARAGFIVHDTTTNFTLRDLLNYYNAS